MLRPDVRNGGVRLSGLANGQSQFSHPNQFEACRAVLLKDAMDSSFEDARGIVRKIHVIWGRTSAHQLKRILVDTGGAKRRLLQFAY